MYVENPSPPLMRKIIVASGLIDWVPAYDIMAASVADISNVSDAEYFEISKLLREFLEEDIFEIGDVTRNGFESWEQQGESGFQKALESLSPYRHEETSQPFWLKLTQNGKNLAEKYDLELYPPGQPDRWVEI